MNGTVPPASSTAKPLSSSRNQLALIVALGMAFLPVGMDVYASILSDMAQAFGRDIGWAQYAFSSYLGGFALAHIAIGPLADRYGRRPVMLAGLALFTLASAAAAMAPDLNWMLAARFVEGLGAAAGPILVRTIVRDTLDPVSGGHTLALGGLGMGIVPVFGPWFASSLVAIYGWRAALWVIVGYGVVGTVAISILVRETLVHKHKLERFGGWPAALREVLPDPEFLRWSGCVALAYAGLAIWIANASSVLMGHYHVSHGAYGIYYAGVTIGFIIGSFTAARILRHHSLARSAATGAAILIVSGAALLGFAAAGVDAALAIASGIAIYPLGWAMVQPAAQSGALVGHAATAGRASAIYGFIQLCTGAIAAAVLGPFVDGEVVRLGIIYVIIGFAILGLTAGAKPAS